MKFELLPTIEIMIDLYERPRTIERFQAYLKVLQGNEKGNLAIPISGFNPMAKEHLLDKLRELQRLGAENIIKETLDSLNIKHISVKSDINFKVALNLSDDLKGGWTNRFTSDYDSKFKMNGVFSRNFCTPIFWSSESFTKELIRRRTLEYVFRTVYWLTHPKPKTLKAHLEQEVFVARETNHENVLSKSDFQALEVFYNNNENTDSYHIIFNFLYGDEASSSLGFPTFGIVESVTGFDYSVYLARKEKIKN